MRRSRKWLFTSPKYQNSTNSNTFLFSFLRFPLSRNSGEEVVITDVRHSILSISFPIISSWPFWFNIYKIIWRNLMPASQIKRLLYKGFNRCLLPSMPKAHPQIVHYRTLERLLFVLVTVFFTRVRFVLPWQTYRKLLLHIGFPPLRRFQLWLGGKSCPFFLYKSF